MAQVRIVPIVLNIPGHPVDLVSPVRRPTDPEVDKSAFRIDEQLQTVTCPNGQTVSAKKVEIDDQQRKAFNFIFDRAFCEKCPWLFGSSRGYPRIWGYNW